MHVSVKVISGWLTLEMIEVAKTSVLYTQLEHFSRLDDVVFKILA